MYNRVPNIEIHDISFMCVILVVYSCQNLFHVLSSGGVNTKSVVTAVRHLYALHKVIIQDKTVHALSFFAYSCIFQLESDMICSESSWHRAHSAEWGATSICAMFSHWARAPPRLLFRSRFSHARLPVFPFREEQRCSNSTIQIIVMFHSREPAQANRPRMQ